MRRRWFLSAAGLSLAALTCSAALAAPPDPDTADRCHGTAIEFADSPKEAARQAKQEEKLVLVLHVSGHFEDPRFT